MREMVEMGAEKEKQVPITSKEAEGGILRVSKLNWLGLCWYLVGLVSLMFSLVEAVCFDMNFCSEVEMWMQIGPGRWMMVLLRGFRICKMESNPTRWQLRHCTIALLCVIGTRWSA